jgi:beta-xylosidase
VVDCPETFQNPLIWEDLPDPEVIRVDDVYYYTASSFHYSPGAPLLRSYDLVNWEYIAHTVPALDFHPSYALEDGHAYVNGVWASTLQYRASNQTYYWMGCMHNVGGGYVFTSKSPTGPWEKHSNQQCYYDMGLLIDDDDKMYVAYGNNTISVAELSEDGFSEVRRQEVYQTPSTLSGPLEGSRFIKIEGMYYILLTQYANGEYVLRSQDPFGPYEMRPFAVSLPYAGTPGSGSAPHQGGIVQTTKGDWYYMAFNDSYPAGRIPVLAPITFTDGWPSVNLVNGEWGGTYPFPDVTCRAVTPRPKSDTFSGSTLHPEWQWNHHADDSKWSVGDGLTLQTATVTNDLYMARNTLTRRIPGPASTGTIELDYSAMANGDVAGLAAFRDTSAWIGVKKADGATRVVMTNGLTMEAGTWETTGLGSEVADADITGGKIWLRAEIDVRTNSGGGTARFSYSTDGTTFTALGNTLTLNKNYQYFMGYRFGIFNYATQALGGSVKIASFQLDDSSE